MAKNYSINRLPKKIKSNNLSKYERWILEKVSKGYRVESILKERNKFKESDFKRLDIKKQYSQVSQKAIYNTISKIEKKTFQKVYLTKKKYLKSVIPKNCYWRLHAEGFSIKILQDTPKYKQLLQETDIKYKDNNTICLYKGYLVIWSNKDFWGEDPKESLYESQKYWNKFLKELQLEYGILLIKKQNTKIHKFRQHIAHIDDSIAKANKRNGEFKVLDENGELIFLADNSFGMIEGEWVHNSKAPSNADTHSRFIKDLDRNPDALMLGDLTKEINSLKSQNVQLNNIVLESANNINNLTNVLIENNQLTNNQIQGLTNNLSTIVNLLNPKMSKCTEKDHNFELNYFK